MPLVIIWCLNLPSLFRFLFIIHNLFSGYMNFCNDYGVGRLKPPPTLRSTLKLLSFSYKNSQKDQKVTKPPAFLKILLLLRFGTSELQQIEFSIICLSFRSSPSTNFRLYKFLFQVLFSFINFLNERVIERILCKFFKSHAENESRWYSILWKIRLASINVF